MRRNHKKLSLRRETVLALDPNQLDRAVGGKSPTYIPCWLETKFCPTYTCTDFCTTTSWVNC